MAPRYRLNPDVKFYTLTLRERARVLLHFLRKVASNWFEEYYTKYMRKDVQPDLTRVDPNMWHSDSDVFIRDFMEYNHRFYNFIYQLLFTGWAENDSYSSPGTHSPFRARLIGDNEADDDWHGGHREWFCEMYACFMELHKSNEEKTVPPQSMIVEGWRRSTYHLSQIQHLEGLWRSTYTLSQIQYLPETIRRVVANCVDRKAQTLLGKPIADSIDLYRLIRETYEAQKEYLSAIQWMPCLGVAREDFVPLESFEGYNPHHERYGGESMNNIDYTGLTWGMNGDEEEDEAA